MNSNDLNPGAKFMVSKRPMQTCPHCQRTYETEGGPVTVLEFGAVQEKCTCHNCNATWVEVFAAVGYEQLVTDDLNMDVDQLAATFPNGHPKLSHVWWQQVVAAGNTKLGYFAWLFEGLRADVKETVVNGKPPEPKFRREDKPFYVRGDAEVQVEVVQVDKSIKGDQYLYTIELPDGTRMAAIGTRVLNAERTLVPKVQVEIQLDGCLSAEQAVRAGFKDIADAANFEPGKGFIPLKHAFDNGQKMTFNRQILREERDCPYREVEVIVIGKLHHTGFDTDSTFPQKGPMYLVKPRPVESGWSGGLTAFQAWESELEPV